MILHLSWVPLSGFAHNDPEYSFSRYEPISRPISAIAHSKLLWQNELTGGNIFHFSINKNSMTIFVFSFILASTITNLYTNAIFHFVFSVEAIFLEKETSQCKILLKINSNDDTSSTDSISISFLSFCVSYFNFRRAYVVYFVTLLCSKDKTKESKEAYFLWFHYRHCFQSKRSLMKKLVFLH